MVHALRIAAIFIAVGCGIFAVIIFSQLNRFQRWPTTAGTVISSDIVRKTIRTKVSAGVSPVADHWVLDVRYAFRVGSSDYTGAHVSSTRDHGIHAGWAATSGLACAVSRALQFRSAGRRAL